LLVWPFVWFVVVFGFGAVHPQRTRRLGFIVVYTQKAVVIRAEQHMRGIYIIFSTKSLGRRCCWFGRLFVFVVAFGCGVVLHTSAEEEALGNRRVTQEAGIIRAHAWYLQYFLNKMHWRRCCWSGRLCGVWWRWFGSGAVCTADKDEIRFFGTLQFGTPVEDENPRRV